MVCEAKSYKHLGFAMSTSLGLMAHPFIRNRIIDVSQHVELKESTFRALLRLPRLHRLFRWNTDRLHPQSGNVGYTSRRLMGRSKTSSGLSGELPAKWTAEQSGPIVAGAGKWPKWEVASVKWPGCLKPATFGNFTVCTYVCYRNAQVSCITRPTILEV